MPFVPFPGVAQINLQFLYRGVPTVNTLYVSKALLSAWNSAELINAAQTAKAWWIANLRPTTAAEMALTGVKATDLGSETGGTVTDVASLPANGALNVESAPSTVALCVKFGTAARGRGARGRNYVGGLPYTALVDNNWTGAMANTVQTAYEEFGSYTTEVDLVHVVCSRYLNNVPRLVGLSRPVTSYEITTLRIANQRNRRD